MIISHTETIHQAHGIIGMDFAVTLDALDKEGVMLASAEADKLDLEDEGKRIMAACYLRAEGKNIEEKKSLALQDAEYLAHLREYQKSRRTWLVLRKKYSVLQASLDVGRTLLSFKKKELEHLG